MYNKWNIPPHLHSVPFVQGIIVQTYEVIHGDRADTPSGQTPPGQTLPWSGTPGQTSPWADASPGQTPPRQTPTPWADTAPGRHPYGQTTPPILWDTVKKACSMHPTGMYTC